MYLHGGIERVLSVKANYLASDKTNEIYIVTTEQKKKDSCYSLNSNIHIQDIEINYNRTKSYFHPENLKKLPNHIFRIRKKIKEINPNVVVVCSHSTDTYFLPFILKKIPKIKEFHYSKFIEEIYRLPNAKSKKKYFLKFTDYVESKYDKLVVLNKDEQKYYKSKNTIIIPNPLTFFPDSVSNLESNLFIAAGRIADVKRFDLLIDIWEIVSQKNSLLKLHIYGFGDLKYIEFLKNKIKEKKLENTILFKGSTDNIKEKMLDAMAYVMTSKNECFPLVLLEAQSCGLPVISFDCPHGPRNIITENSGILISMSNKKQFAKAVVEIASNIQYRNVMGKMARENSLNYKIDKVMPMWIKLFNDLNK